MKNLKVIIYFKMAEIVLDDNKICVPTRLKVLTFLSELQKKTKQIIYLINEKEIGIFESLNDVKRGMWRRLKPTDGIAYYYIDPDTQNEYTLFLEECAIKLGNFPYEIPNRVPQQAYTRSTPSTIDQSATYQSYQQTLPSYRPLPSKMTSNSFQATQMSNNLQAPIPQTPLNIPQPHVQPHVQPQSYPNFDTQSSGQQNQYHPIFQKYNDDKTTNLYSMYQNLLQTPPPPPQQTQNQPQQQYMSNKSIQNLNRIMAYTQKQQLNYSEPPQPVVNNWTSSMDQQTSQYNPMTSQQFNVQSQYNGQPNMYNPPLQQTSYNPPAPIPQYNPQTSYQQPSQPMNFESTQPRMSAISTTSTVNGNEPNGTRTNPVVDGKRDQFKYFPPGQRKKPATSGAPPQNVAPQIVETKFSA